MKFLIVLFLISCASDSRYKGNKIHIGEGANYRTQAVSETREIMTDSVLQKELKFITNLNDVLIEYDRSEKECLPGIDYYNVSALYAIEGKEGEVLSKVCKIELSHGSCKGQGAVEETKIISKKDCVDFN